MRKVKRGNVTLKLWDIGGWAFLYSSLPDQSLLCHRQARFRSMWQRYARGANAILLVRHNGNVHKADRQICRFVVDSADLDQLESAKAELLSLLEKPELAGIPVLVLCNKSDLPQALKVEQMVDKLCVRCPNIECQLNAFS